MAIAFQHDTGYNIITHQAPLTDQISYFRAGFARALQASQMVSNTGNKYDSCFSVASVCSIKALIDDEAPGVQRRPFLSDASLLHIGKNITTMFDCGGAYRDKPCSIQCFNTDRKKWTPDILLDIQARVHRRKRERDEARAAATAEQHAALEIPASEHRDTLQQQRPQPQQQQQ